MDANNVVVEALTERASRSAETRGIATIRLFRRILPRNFILLLTICWLTPVWAALGAPEVQSVGLSPQEKAWLLEHPVVRVSCDPEWPPFTQFGKDGALIGIDRDICALLERRLPIRFEFVRAKNWEEAERLLADGEVDLLLSTARTSERSARYDFTNEYVSFPAAIVRRLDAPFLTTLADLKTAAASTKNQGPDGTARHGLTVAGPKAHVTTERIQQECPGATLILTETASEAFRLVAEGKSDVTVQNLAVSSYTIYRKGYSNLKIAGFTSFHFGLRLAVRRDKPMLRQSLDKAISAITDLEREAILARHLRPETMTAEGLPRWRENFWVLVITAIGILALLLLWNASLKSEIRKRRRAERDLKAIQDDLERRVEARTRALSDAYDSLARTERRFRCAFDLSPDGLLISRAADGIVVEVNAAAEKIFRQPREGLIGITLPQLRITPARSESESGIESLVASTGADKGTSAETYELDREGPSGETMRLLISKVPLEFDATPCQITSVRDVTERSIMAAQLHQAQKMDAVGRLAGGIAHDINNILTVIAGNADLVLDEKPNDTIRGLIAEVSEAAFRAANLTRQLLVFSRLHVVRKKVLQLDSVVAGMRRLLLRLLPDAVELVIEPSPPIPHINGDLSMIEQVVLNLVVNARDAVAGRGRVVISTGTYDLQAEDPRCRAEVVAGRYVVMRVSDTGEGIAPEHLGRIFEPFYTTKESGTGTGLGLATVFGVVRQHGGWVDVQSTVGRGTEVTVAFPVAPKPVSEVSDPIASPADGAGMGAILHVDVDEQVLALAGRTLQRYGYEPIAAQSGESAEELLDTHRNRIRLAIVNRDLTPEMSGAECAERLRRRAPGLTTLMTTDLSRDDVTSGENRNSAAPTTVLCKPFRPMDLVDRVRQILDEPNGSE